LKISFLLDKTVILSNRKIKKMILFEINRFHKCSTPASDIHFTFVLLQEKEYKAQLLESELDQSKPRRQADQE
jgi:hypothetical protein